MTKKRQYRRYGPEFKKSALKRAAEEDVTDVQVCQELGISARQLRPLAGEEEFVRTAAAQGAAWL